MSESAQFTIGSNVVCADGACGELRRVVVDPLKRTLTHLVVEPRHEVANGRLVPIELVESAGEDEIRLRCTTSEFDRLEDAEDRQFMPGARGEWGYSQGQMLSQPYIGLGLGLGLGMGGMGTGLGVSSFDPVPRPIITDRVPVGEVEVRRGDHVQATDGAIGRVQGLVVDPSDHHVTHFLLDEGHLWGQKRVAIPIGAVKEVTRDQGVLVKLTKDEVRDLPPVELEEPHES